MKHIGFDQSTVLNEYARIASEQGVIKTAAAEEKNYDVTGETGEQLVEKAHPGGGTRTELTHSKTDENLVETIVEQQGKDIEVAKSVPKGTYAALVGLYNKLNKMGHKSHLNDLAKTIHLVATPEDIIAHTLVTLADELDRRGLKNVAASVDNILKKKIAEVPLSSTVAPNKPSSNPQQLRQLLKNLENKMVDTFADAMGDEVPGFGIPTVILNVKGKGKRFRDAVVEFKKLVAEDPKLQGPYNVGMAAVAPLMSQYSALMQALRAAQSQSVVAPRDPAAGVAKKSPAMTPEESDAARKKDRLVGLRKRLQRVLDAKVPAKIVADGVIGKMTRAAIAQLKMPDGSPVLLQGMTLAELIKRVEQAPAVSTGRELPGEIGEEGPEETRMINITKRDFFNKLIPSVILPQAIDIVGRVSPNGVKKLREYLNKIGHYIMDTKDVKNTEFGDVERRDKYLVSEVLKIFNKKIKHPKTLNYFQTI